MGMKYAVRIQGDNVIVESQDPNGKQVFFGWGGGGYPHGLFYGNDVRGSHGPNQEPRQRFTLPPDAVEVMLGNLNTQLTVKEYKDKLLEPAARELQRKLREAKAKIKAAHKGER